MLSVVSVVLLSVEEIITNPFGVSYWLLKVFPEESFTLVFTRILYEVPKDKPEDGVTVNVLSEFDSVGWDVIKTHVLKLSEETSKVPERQLLAELTEIVLVSIEFEKVTEMSTLAETEVALSDGEVDNTVGASVSSSTQEIMVRLKRNMANMMSICLNCFPISV